MKKGKHQVKIVHYTLQFKMLNPEEFQVNDPNDFVESIKQEYAEEDFLEKQ